MMKYFLKFIVLLLITSSCEQEDPVADPEIPKDPEAPGKLEYRIPVVVHVLHKGEPEGTGYNLSTDRIERQIAILNEDFQRKEGTRGYNEHPDGADSGITFILAKTDPDGNPTNGIVRIDATGLRNPVPTNYRFDFNAWYSYWDHTQYLNVWVEPFSEATVDLYLGVATGPSADLPGIELMQPGEPLQAEGILINSFHFGETDLESEFNLGRTLTHEVGHYLGLLHLWGNRDCATNDYCADTPPVTRWTVGCPKEGLIACDGTPAMVRNYMDWTSDACAHIFTRDQVSRMHYVLETSRKSLLTSKGLAEP